MKYSKNFNQKQIEAIKHIRNWLMHHGHTPSVRNLMRALGYKSPKSAQDILKQLEEKGVIKKQASGNFQLIMDPDFGFSHAKTVNIPIVGEVICGAPILAEEKIEGFLSVSTSLAKPGFKYFLLHAKGDSMDKAGINDGDLVLVRQQATADEGDNVVALVDDEATIKEFHHVNSMIILKPKSTNKKHQPIVLISDFQVQGVVITTIPKFEE